MLAYVSICLNSESSRDVMFVSVPLCSSGQRERERERERERVRVPRVMDSREREREGVYAKLCITLSKNNAIQANMSTLIFISASYFRKMTGKLRISTPNKHTVIVDNSILNVARLCVKGHRNLTRPPVYFSFQAINSF